MDNKRPLDFFIYKNFNQVQEDDFTRQLNDSSPLVPLHRRSSSDFITSLNTSSLKQSDSNNGYVKFQGQSSSRDILTLPSDFEVKTGDIHAFEGQSSHENKLTLAPHSEVKNKIQYDQQAKYGPDPKTNNPKILKRLIANRESAQRSRLRKQKHVESLVKNHELLQAQVKNLHAQIHSQRVEYTTLQKENEEMKEKLQYLEAVKDFKEAEYEAMKREKEMLSLSIQLKQKGIIF